MTSTPGAASLDLRRRAQAILRIALPIPRSIGQALAPWLDLLIRVSLAQAFLAIAAMDVLMHARPAMIGDGSWIARFNDLVASPIGVVVQVVCPVMLLIGLASRLCAVPLLIQAVWLHEPTSSTPSLFWIALLGQIIVMGPGPLSVDAILQRGLDSSAVPGAARLAAAFAALTRVFGPWYWLVLRLWIAMTPLAAALVSLGWALPDATRSLAAGLALLPNWITALPPSLSVAACILLALGLGTRLDALILMLAIPIGQVGMALDVRLYWAMLFGLFICRGAGPLALDRWLAARAAASLRRMAPISPTSLPHVVIVGGGFGGVAAARGLKRAPCRITLIDRCNHHLFQPLLYQVATAGLSPADIATPIRSLFRTQDNLRVRFGAVQGVSTATGEVILDGSRISYDFLVLATGSRHSYFGRDDWAADAPGLKSIEDATAIRRRLLIAFEWAEASTDPDERSAAMTFVIVGGGPTGVELAGAIAELARHGLEREFRAIDPAEARVILVQSAPRLLPTFPASLSADAEVELKRLGVEIRTGAKVEHVDAGGVTVSGTRVAAKTVLWAAGVTASPAGDWLRVPTDQAGRVIVGPDLSVDAHDNVFAIGDTAASLGWNGKPVPGLAPAAKQGGSHVAKQIRARLSGRAAPRPFLYRHAGSLATIGRSAAVAEFGPLRLRGALAWWIWGVVHILFLAGGRNRATVVVEWAWAYLTYRRGSRLITEVATARKP